VIACGRPVARRRPAASLRAWRSGKPDSDARKDGQARPGQTLRQLRSQGSHGTGRQAPGQDLLGVPAAVGLTSRQGAGLAGGAGSAVSSLTRRRISSSVAVCPTIVVASW
jgi:hypothetical protein